MLYAFSIPFESIYATVPQTLDRELDIGAF